MMQNVHLAPETDEDDLYSGYNDYNPTYDTDVKKKIVSLVPFSSCPQSFPASGSFPMSQLSASGGQSIGASASTSVLPMNTQD